MQSDDIELVQYTLMKMLPKTEQVARRFYDRLFELDPSIRPLFKGDMKQQGQKFMSTLSHVVHWLDRLDEIRAELEKLGHEHVTFGVQREHYGTVETALLWAIEETLGDAYTPEVEAAWRGAYEAVADIMKGAMA